MVERAGRTFAIVMILFSLYQSVYYRWLSDDAFISFTYARNLAAGNGLVFNIGERVEGYTNFLWTVLLAGGFKSGVQPEILAQIAGVASQLLLLVLLFVLSGRHGWFAVISWAAFRHGWYFATSGLETPFFTLLVTAGVYSALFMNLKNYGYFLLVAAALTRPEGVYFIGLVSAAGLFKGERMQWLKLQLWLLPVVVYYIWKYSYYGELLPNTYYAKSGYDSYWPQGWNYLLLFVKAYPLLVVLLPVVVYAVARGSHAERFTGIIIAGYIIYVMKVGGDFMFARFFIPVIPLTLVLTGIMISKWLGIKYHQLAQLPGYKINPAVIVPVLGVLVTGIFINPFTNNYLVDGIGEERMFYRLDRGKLKYNPEIFRRMNVAFYGAQSHFIYYMQPALAIESQTGLTDLTIARQKGVKRGVVGHEKLAPLDYLRSRGVNLVMADVYPELQGDYKDFYLDWNGQRLRFKILIYDREKFAEMSGAPEADFSGAEKYLARRPELLKTGRIDFSD